MAKVAVLGYGTVGSGIVEVINTNQELIAKRVGCPVEVKYILDLRDFPGDPYENLVVHDVDVIMNDPEVEIVCEAMGGTGAAYAFTKTALSKGKSVCTSNKALVAEYGTELIELAKANKCNYLFEASCGGGIPIIRPLRTSLSPEKIVAIKGILNGTTNYILTRMEQEGADFDSVLKDAQALGYAEANPEADVEGHDACRKIAILSSLMCSKNVRYEEIYTEGITKISAADFAYAKQMNKSIKLLAMSRDKKEGFFAMVAPFMIPRTHPLYSVSDVFNAVYVHGNMLGDSMYYGRGAGKLPTASAVVSDVVDCARHPGKTVMCFWENEDVKVADIESDQGKFFVRVGNGQKEEALTVFGSLAEINVGIAEEFAFMTQVMTEKEFNDKIEKIGGCINRIRILSA